MGLVVISLKMDGQSIEKELLILQHMPGVPATHAKPLTLDLRLEHDVVKLPKPFKEWTGPVFKVHELTHEELCK